MSSDPTDPFTALNILPFINQTVMKKILITTSSFGQAGAGPIQMLEHAGIVFDLNPHKRKLTEDEAIELLSQNSYQGMIAGVEPLTRKVLESAPSLRVISRCGTGIDNVDLVAAAELGITVTTTCNAHVNAVAELTLAGALAVLRHISVSDQGIRRGEWPRRIGALLYGKTVGLIGFGRVGQEAARLFKAFKADVLVVDVKLENAVAEQAGVSVVTIEELLRSSDIVSLHVPYTPSTHRLLDRARLDSLKDNAILINTSRGGLIDEGALYLALQEGRIGGAYLDVFEMETYSGALAELDNIVLTPHIGSFAVEARVMMEHEAVENALANMP